MKTKLLSVSQFVKLKFLTRSSLLQNTGSLVRIVMLFSMCFFIVSLSAQNYTFTHGTFNSSGGHQASSAYSNTTAFGEMVQGEISTSGYTGYLGFLFPILNQQPPTIISIDDVPNNQGHQIQIDWNKCAFDDAYSYNTYYSIWRLDDEAESRNGSVRKVNKLPDKSSKNNKRQDPVKTYLWQRDDSVWTFVDSIQASNNDQYSSIEATLADSSSSNLNYSTFKVIYHNEYNYYESVPDSGYSVDNIPPDETQVTIAKNGNYMRLTWQEVEYGTYQGSSYSELNGIWYRIYAGDTDDFICDGSHFINTVTALSYDYLLMGEYKKFFKIVVSDQP